MKFRSKALLFIICLAALIVFQNKAVLPFIYKVDSSDLFFDTDKPNPSLDAISDKMPLYAFDQCNNYIANNLDSDEMSVSFSNEPVNIWAFAAKQYVINADIDLLPADGSTTTHRYACRIKYTSDSAKPSDLNNPDNWSIDGIDGIDL